MLAQFRLFDRPFLDSLVGELRASMRALLFDLCHDLEEMAPRSTVASRLPVDYFHRVAVALKPEDFSHWKVVGWIEGLNDLVYFADVHEQLRREADPRGFAEAFFAACEEQFYENSYLDELFPRGEPEHRGLLSRLAVLCRRLGDDATNDALFLVPGLSCTWLVETGRRRWSVPVSLIEDFERAQPAGCIPLDLGGALLVPRVGTRGALNGVNCAALRVSPRGIELCTGAASIPVWKDHQPDRRHWDVRTPQYIYTSHDARGRLILGPTLIYDSNRVPTRIVRSSSNLVRRVGRAVEAIERAWPEGAANFFALTTRIVPIKARGVVSYSYRHRPGLSFINCFERDDLDLIDDLIHENSHHHLNLFLRRAVLLRGDRNQEIFYSPWRRSLRPLRGILHATFTFTMGALLFERLSSHADRLTDVLSPADVLRARTRCFEEIASVQYSLEDLDWAARLCWLTAAGVHLVDELKRHIRQAAKRITPYEGQVNRSRHGKELRQHREELARAAKLYRSGKR